MYAIILDLTQSIQVLDVKIYKCDFDDLSDAFFDFYPKYKINCIIQSHSRNLSCPQLLRAEMEFLIHR